MPKRASKTANNTPAPRAAPQKPKGPPKAGVVTRTSEGISELISQGDGTAVERPIVNAQGEFPTASDDE